MCRLVSLVLRRFVGGSCETRAFAILLFAWRAVPGAQRRPAACEENTMSVSRFGPDCAYRGGSWDFRARSASTANVSSCYSPARFRDLGFRLARRTS